MRLGFLSDAHGNPEGLERCLSTLFDANVDQVYFLGDALGYMPGEVEVDERLHALGAICVRGNHEAMQLGELSVPEANERVYQLRGARARLRPEHYEWIATWPDSREMDVDGRRFLLVHGSPSDALGGYVYPDSDLADFADLPYDHIVMGQTLRPFARSAGRVKVVNVGSCGMPRDVGNVASCGVFDTQTEDFELLRCPFDAEAVIASYAGAVHEAVIACLRRT